MADTTSLGNNVVIKDGVRLGKNIVIEDDVTIDYNCIIRDNVRIKAGTYIGPNCILGEHLNDFYSRGAYDNPQLVIGKNSVIRSGTVIYAGCEFGDRLQTGHNVTVREYTKLGSHVSLGTLTDIQGHCIIGDYTRLHSNVHIGQKSKIGDYVWIFPYVVLTNDPTPPSDELLGVTIESFAVVTTGAIILPGVKIHSDSLVAAGAVVTKDVMSGEVVGGVPGKVISDISKIKNHIDGESVYPWRYSFDRGMPWEGKGYDKWVMAQNNSEGMDKKEDP